MSSILPDVLLTYGWCRVSYVILRALALRNVRVHVADASPLAMSRFSRDCFSFHRYTSPYEDPEGFVDDLVKILKRTGARVLIPGHEDVLPITRMQSKLPHNTMLPFSTPALIEATINKWKVIELALAAGVPVPKTFKPESRYALVQLVSQITYPAVVKTEIGNSAKGVCIVQNPEDCITKFDHLVREYGLKNPNLPMIQEYALGTGYGVCLLYNHGKLRAFFCERYVRCKDGDVGTSVFRESVYVQKLVDYARRLMDGLKWHGPVHLDFLYEEESGKAAFIEVNPRFWGALDLAVRSGVDFPWLLYKMAIDGDVEPITDYKIGVRSRWILGDILHLVNHFRKGNTNKPLSKIASLLRPRPDGNDDFSPTDPLPLLAEMIYYGFRFLSTGSTNPVEKGMIG